MLYKNIDNQEINLFKKKGYLHLKNFFSKKFVKKILEELKKNNKHFDKSIRLLNAHRSIPIIKKLFKNKEIVHLVKKLLNVNEIMGLQSELFINPPHKSKGHPPHQDDFFLKTGKGNSLNFWIPLVDTNKKNGALVFYENSHRGGIKKKINNILLNKKSKNLLYLKEYKSKTLNCKLGDVVIIGNSIFHKSHNNISKKIRPVIAYGYMKKGSNYVRGHTAKRIPIKID